MLTTLRYGYAAAPDELQDERTSGELQLTSCMFEPGRRQRRPGTRRVDRITHQVTEASSELVALPSWRFCPSPVQERTGGCERAVGG
ncbi:MAG: hypothetical protein WBY94_29525 [Polyangiaceae bacterium]